MHSVFKLGVMLLFCVFTLNCKAESNTVFLTKGESAEVTYWKYPVENGTVIDKEQYRSLRQEMTIGYHEYVITNDSDDYAFVWFGEEDFKRYIFAPKGDFSMYTVFCECTSTMQILDPIKEFSRLYIKFIKLMKPHSEFRIVVFDDKNEFDEEIVLKSIQYAKKSDTLLSDDTYMVDVLLKYVTGYPRDLIVLNMDAFNNQVYNAPNGYLIKKRGK